MVKCRYCERSATPTPTRAKNLLRFRNFMLLAVALFFAGAVAWASGATAWAWWIGGTGMFVLLQALLKWHESRWMLCESRQHGFTYYGRIS